LLYEDRNVGKPFWLAGRSANEGIGKIGAVKHQDLKI
jgi:hypothetical protein